MKSTYNLKTSCYKAATSLLGIVLCLASVRAEASEISELESAQLSSLNTILAEGEIQDLESITIVDFLRNISADDWAYSALENLANNYNCLPESSDRTYQNKPSITRYEFAAALNKCLEKINAGARNLLAEERQSISRLVRDFQGELAFVRKNVDEIKDRIVFLEESQFSPTTFLEGSVLIQLGDTFGNRAREPGNLKATDTTQTFLGYRVELDLETSFTGRDLLAVTWQSRELPTFDSEELNNTQMTRLRTRGDTEGKFIIDEVFYRFPIFKDRGRAIVGIKGIGLNDLGSSLNPAAGSLSRFGRRNPFTLRGGGNAGGGLRLDLDPEGIFQLSLGYLGEDAEDPRENRGLFNGSFSILTQLLIEPNDNFEFAFDYVYKYQTSRDVNVTSSTGSFVGRRPFERNDTASNNFGFSFEWEINPQLDLGGWWGIALAEQKSGGDNNATLHNWALGLSFLDLFAEGNRGGIIVGMPSKLTYNSISDRVDRDTSIHWEVLYSHRVNKYITIIPGFYAVTNPNHDDRNDTIWVTVVRTEFEF